MAESRENRRETRLPGAGFAYIRGRERRRRPLRSAEYLRNGSEKNVHRRVGKVKERVRMSATRGRQRAGESTRSRAQRQSEKGIRREDGKRQSSPIEPAEFYPKLSVRLLLLPVSFSSTSSTFHFISLPRAFRSRRPVLFPFFFHRVVRFLLSFSPRYNSPLPRDYREEVATKRATERERGRMMLLLREKGRQKEMTVDESPC